MRKNFGAKPYTYPQPVLIIATYNENGTADAMNAAWGGISDDTQISMCLSAEHKTVKNILTRGAFTVSMADAAHVTECDYVGIVSANDVPDKLAKAGFHTTKAEFVDAPLIDELPMALECTQMCIRDRYMVVCPTCTPSSRRRSMNCSTVRKRDSCFFKQFKMISCCFVLYLPLSDIFSLPI